MLGIARLEGTIPTTLEVTVGGKPVAPLSIVDGPWVELTFEIPTETRGDRVAVEVTTTAAPFTSFHYWFGAP